MDYWFKIFSGQPAGSPATVTCRRPGRALPRLQRLVMPGRGLLSGQGSRKTAAVEDGKTGIFGDEAERPPPLPAHQEAGGDAVDRSEEHTSELQSLMRISYAVFCLKKQKKK